MAVWRQGGALSWAACRCKAAWHPAWTTSNSWRPQLAPCMHLVATHPCHISRILLSTVLLSDLPPGPALCCRSCWATSCRTCPPWTTLSCTSGSAMPPGRSASRRCGGPASLHASCLWPGCMTHSGWAATAWPGQQSILPHHTPPPPASPLITPLPAPPGVQAWLRRGPRPWMTSMEERLQAHEDFMKEGHVSGGTV